METSLVLETDQNKTLLPRKRVNTDICISGSVLTIGEMRAISSGVMVQRLPSGAGGRASQITSRMRTVWRCTTGVRRGMITTAGRSTVTSVREIKVSAKNNTIT